MEPVRVRLIIPRGWMSVTRPPFILIAHNLIPVRLRVLVLVHTVYTLMYVIVDEVFILLIVLALSRRFITNESVYQRSKQASTVHTCRYHHDERTPAA
jgi:hypothetical protein